MTSVAGEVARQPARAKVKEVRCRSSNSPEQISIRAHLPSGWFVILAFSIVISGQMSARAQQPTASPSPTPPRTGRSYNVGDLPKTPPPPGPQAKSPVTFTDITEIGRASCRERV